MTGRIDQIALLAAVLLVCGAVAEKVTLQSPPDVRAYRERVRHAFDSFGSVSGDWVSKEVAVPAEAMKMLRPNSIMSRQYTNVVTGYRCSVLLVDCSDARDLVCHYPPVCYPGQGWKLISKQAQAWEVGGGTIAGTNYEFSRSDFESGTGILAANTMILPDGQFKPDMRGVEEAAANVHRRGYGAAQIQVIVDGAMSEMDRARVIQAMLELHKPLFDAIRSAGH
jgi:hypothetical protein